MTTKICYLKSNSSLCDLCGKSNISFCALLDAITDALAAGDGPDFAQLFTQDGAYIDGFYGPFQARQAIAKMLEEHFHHAAKDFHWRMYDPVDNAVTSAILALGFIGTEKSVAYLEEMPLAEYSAQDGTFFREFTA